MKFRLRNRSVLPRIVRVIARMEEGARKARENCDLIERIPMVESSRLKSDLTF